jgi:glucose/arabinose dehydrogenase
VENGEIRAEPFLDITDRVLFDGCCGEEVGLLGVAFHPDYANNGWVFVNYSSESVDNVIARFEKMDGVDALDPASEKLLFTIPQDDEYHNGGQLQFDDDGMLWIGNGDGNGAQGGDPAGHAQADFDILGKLLRVDVDVENAPYWAVPADNPNPGTEVTSLIWSKGLRNPWRFSFDRVTGDMIIADVGQGEVEEISLLPAESTGGENFGWNVFEGTQCFDGGCSRGAPEFEAPIYEYRHEGGGASITGGYVYRGCAMPDLHGTYFYGDFVRGFVATLEIANGQASNPADVTSALDPSGDATIGNPSSFGEDGRGELYIADYYDGEVFKIVPR